VDGWQPTCVHKNNIAEGCYSRFNLIYTAVYVFKKALFLANALNLRFGPESTTSHNLPIPDTSQIPAYSDNVLPSMLVYLGVIDLSSCGRPELRAAFPNANPEALLAAWTTEKAVAATVDDPKRAPKDGAHLSHEDAYVLRAAAVDACELIVAEAREMSGSHADRPWLGTMTLPEIDAWLWAVAKDRKDYRALPRFVERDTVFF
jgi:hypothetical protein